MEKEMNETPENLKVIIVMDGGIVQNVLVNSSVDVTIIDYDVEGGDPNDFKQIRNQEAYVFEPNVEENVEEMQLIYNDIEKAKLEADEELS